MLTADLDKRIRSYEKEIVDLLSEITSLMAISPTSNGTGEGERAEFLSKILSSWGFEVKRYEYKDEYEIKRPNLIVKLGNCPQTLWIMPHMDTVSEGDISLWKTYPFKAVVKNGKVYGRGVCDNGQELVAAMFALRVLKESMTKLKYNFGLALVADEETGSKYGAKELVHEKGLFEKNDSFIVPDWGNAAGDEIGVAEKGCLWFKFTFTGKQVHASTPDEGINAYKYSVKYLDKLTNLLYSRYNKKDDLFDPVNSTFEITKHEKGVESINIIPGTEVAYMDCRILPGYDLDKIVADARELAESPEFKPIHIKIETVAKGNPSPVTPNDSEVVKLLLKSIKEVMNVNAISIGSGARTCAVFIREAGWNAATWSKQEEVAHRPNEHANISDIINDTRVFVRLFIDT